MGVQLRELVALVKVEVELESFSGRVITLDAYNALYQFLATIRQPDGTPLIDAYGRVTSHLSGLLYRTVNFLERGLRPVYVFDGKPPELKAAEIERRMKTREEAERKYVEALEKGELERARVYAQQATKLTSPMVEEAKRLLNLMGVSWIQAPAEGEAQAAHMAAKGDTWAAGSQDYDSLLYGAPRLVRNLNVTGRRKLPGRDEYVEVKPEVIELNKLLKHYGVTREQLVYIGVLLGTDYNPSGVKGAGVKRALKLVKEIREPEALARAVGWDFSVPLEEIAKLFLQPQVTDEYSLSWRAPDREGLTAFLCDEHQFSRERVERAVEKLERAYKGTLRQATLESWFS